MHLDATNRSSAYAQHHLNCEDAAGMPLVIMVCIADAEWTAAALRTACWIARRKGARIVLLAAGQTEDMHADAANSAAPAGSSSKSGALETGCETAEDFGLDCEVRRCANPSQPAAIVAAARSLQANIVFARLPDHRFPLWSAVQYRTLRWQLAELGCDLYVDEFSRVEGVFARYTLP